MVALTVIAVTACSTSECYDNHSAMPLATFYSAATRQKVSVSQLRIYGVGAPGDSILYTPQTLGEAYLPFRLWQDTTQYVFEYMSMAVIDTIADEVVYVPSDTLTFVYRPKEWFVSPSCGAMYFFEMDTVVHTSLMIDSLAYNKLITNENITNIQIFFRDASR